MKNKKLPPITEKRIKLVPIEAAVDEFGNPFIKKKSISINVFFCPVCHAVMNGDYMYYCDKCGQQIKWPEEEG